MVPVTVLLDVTTKVESEPTPGWFHALAVGPTMMTVCNEGGSDSQEESDEPEEELIWGLEGL